MKNTLIFNLESIGKKKEHLTSAELSRLYLNLLRDCLDFQQFPTEQFLDRFVNNTITSLRQTSDLDTFAITEEIVSLLVKNVDKRQVLMSTSLLPTLFELVLTPTTTFALKKRILELACKIVSLKIPLECRSGVRCNVEKYLYGLVSDFRKSKNFACHPFCTILIFISGASFLAIWRLRSPNFYHRTLGQIWCAKRPRYVEATLSKLRFGKPFLQNSAPNI